MNAEELLRELSSRLGLSFETQDWGIVNANPWRLREFIYFYESEPLVPSQRFELGELILASANERLLAGTAKEDEDMHMFVDFVRNHWREQEAHLTYWLGLQSDEEFPITAVLKQIGAEK
jgi:hypothetical protein